jgi:hypothetical protein
MIYLLAAMYAIQLFPVHATMLKALLAHQANAFVAAINTIKIMLCISFLSHNYHLFSILYKYYIIFFI